MTVQWRIDPSILTGILAVACWYALYAGPLRRRLPGSLPVTASQAANFALALLVLGLALESPLDDLADRYFFFAHMTQHLLLVLVVPVFALAGLPGWMLRPLLAHRAVAAIARRLTRPLVAFSLFNITFAVAHLPPIYNYVATNEPVHALEHLIFVATGLLLWWPVLSPVSEYPRLSYPLQMGYLFLQTIPCSLTAALITLSGSPLYAGYDKVRALTPISAMQDQQIGGLIMWIGGSMYFFLGMATVFFVWASREDREPARMGNGAPLLNGHLATDRRLSDGKESMSGPAGPPVLDAAAISANHR